MEDNTILIVEDEDSVRGLIRLTLGMEGYKVVEAADGNEAEQKIRQGGFDLALLDIMLPGKDGYVLLPLLQAKNIPVIFLTAKTSLSDKVMGLKGGAEDYITKPFEPLELLARVQVVLRRQEALKEAARAAAAEAARAAVAEAAGKNTDRKTSDYEKRNENIQETVKDEILAYSDLEMNVTAHTVSKNEQPQVLTEKEFELLHFLLEHQGQAFSREQILNSVWGYDYFGGTRTVDVHVSSLRSKLSLMDDLETVYKLGYRLRSRK